jgi:hypothetical protein
MMLEALTQLTLLSLATPNHHAGAAPIFHVFAGHPGMMNDPDGARSHSPNSYHPPPITQCTRARTAPLLALLAVAGAAGAAGAGVEVAALHRPVL